LFVAALGLCATAAAAQHTRAVPPLKRAAAPTTPAITAADLMSRVYPYADDSMMGREAGSPHNLKATEFIATELRRLGLTPAGDSGTFFQAVPLVRRQLDEQRSTLTLRGTTLRWGVDYIPRDQGFTTRSVDGVPVVYAGAWGDSAMLAPEQAAGKLVIMSASRRGLPGAPNWFVPRTQTVRRYRDAAGIALVILDMLPEDARASFSEAALTLKVDAPAGTNPLPAYLYLSHATARAMLGVSPDSAAVGAVGTSLGGSPLFVQAVQPARNVVAILPGSDSTLQGQYVAFGAHNDHVGFNHTPVDHDSLRAFNTARRGLPADRVAQLRVNLDSLRRLRPARADSIFNGADDDASGSMALLEIAEAFAGATLKPRRSLLFVWHTAEELGLYGAMHFTDQPTVPRDSIVAQLNLDMVGRSFNGPQYIQLIGSRRLSTELGDIVEQVNRRQTLPFTIDYQYDAPGHPEQYYCRSDHYMYARYGIPVAFFSTGDHQDYHEVTDEPQYLDYDHLRRVTQLVHDVAANVANLNRRVTVDKPKPDPRGQCQQ
jgi:hypothetical protein